MTGGARWGRAVAEGRSRRLVMVVERGRGGEEKEEVRRRRREERWSCMEGCGGDTASGASLQLQLGALSLSPVATFLLITAKS